MKSYIFLSALLLGGICLLNPSITEAKKKAPKEKGSQEQRAPRNSYKFNRTLPVRQLDTYSSTFFSSDNNSVRTSRGDVVHSTGKDTVIDFKINPAGFNFGLVSRDKKGRTKAELYSTLEKDLRITEFDSKRYGAPTAVEYTPDARRVIVAADGKILFLNPREKYKVVDMISDVPFSVEKMTLSPNGYYLAVANGGNVIVYNLEDKSIRKNMKQEEAVTDFEFSPDNSDFAVLTADGLLTLYNTRTFDMRKMIDDLGTAKAGVYNFDGKYMAVVTDDNTVTLVNLLRDSDRESYNSETPTARDVAFISNADHQTLLVIPSDFAVEAFLLPHLKPFYNKLIADEVDRKMDEWLKMMPGETIDEYRARVTDESRRRQRRLFEDEISTFYAGDLLSGTKMSLGSYDRANNVLALNFDSMPTIYLPVSEADVISFKNAADLSLSDVMYGIMPDDTFEIVYAKVTNRNDGKTYIYDNLQRANLNYMADDDAISLELLQQQQMEELKLQEIREKVMQEARQTNVISDHTNITVDSKVVPEYDASGKRILNYQVGVTYTVDPEYSIVEDFGPGKYHVSESGAASSMLNIVKEALEGDLSRYLGEGKKAKIKILGTADATPIVSGIAYDGSYGDFENEPVYIDGKLSALSVNSHDGIKQNEQLALMRAMGVKDYLEKNVKGFKDMNSDYRYEVNVSKDKGSQHRRITLEMVFVDAF